MKESRRSLISKIGAVGIASPGLFGVVGATQSESRPSDVHPDDKMVVSKEELKNYPEMREFFKSSPIYKSRAKGPDNVLFYIDLKAAKKEIDYAELSISGEKSISEQLRETSEWEKLQKKSKQERKEVDQAIKSSMERKSKLRDSQTSEVRTLGHNGDYVTIGSDTQLNSNEYADSDTAGVWGNKSSDADTSNDRLYAECTQAPSYGNAWAWAYLADEFEVSGSSQAFCNVSSNISYDGYLWSAAGGDAEVTITWKLENLTTDHTFDEEHISKSHSGGASNINYKDSDSDAVVVQLTPDHHYRISVRLQVHTSITTTQGAIADFGNIQDGNEHVDAQYYHFDFS